MEDVEDSAKRRRRKVAQGASVMPEDVESWLQECLALVTKFQWLLEQSLTGFYAEGAYERDSWPMPREWRQSLQELTLQECSDLAFGLRKEEWPQSLTEFLDRCQRCSLPRRLREEEGTEVDSIETDGVPSAAVIEELRMEVDVRLRGMKGMKEKKLHEVEVLTGLVEAVAGSTNASTVVDIGAGVGYLCHSLRISCGLGVIGLEGNPAHAQAAAERHQSLEKRLTKATKGPNGQWEATTGLAPIEIMTCYLDFRSPNLAEEFVSQLPSSCDTHTKLDEKVQSETASDIAAVTSSGASQVGDSSDTSPFLTVTGLHCCGDLSPATLRLFASCEQVRGLVLLGCCYHRLSTSATRGIAAEPPYGYPLSERITSAVAAGKAPPLNMIALELGTHCVERWSQRSPELQERNLRSLNYRAVLQAAITPLLPDSCQLVLKKHRAKARAFVSFDKYLDAVLHQVHMREMTEEGWKEVNERPLLPLPVADPQALRPLLHDKFQELSPLFPFLNSLQALKLVLQPVVESLLLVDRVLYIREQVPGAVVNLLPIFDPIVSPRNIAIVSMKRL